MSMQLNRWFCSCRTLLQTQTNGKTSTKLKPLFKKPSTKSEIESKSKRRPKRQPLFKSKKSDSNFHNFVPNEETDHYKAIVKSSKELAYSAVDVPDQPPVPKLAHNLDRVLFSPGVHFLRDPRTNVYNFTPYLENVMSIKDFDFDAVAAYVPSGKDQTLAQLAEKAGKKYTGSTSSLTSALSQLHFLLSHNRPPHTMYLSKFFPGVLTRFSETQRKPVSIFLRYNPNTNTRAVDSDGSTSEDIIVSILGHQLEAMLTTPETIFEGYRKTNEKRDPAPPLAGNTYNYTECDSFLMRSQLDCYDSRLPGTGFFDLKTRAVCAVRHDMDYAQIHDGSHYTINKLDGEFESYAREWYELIRSTMLKYSLQARIGRMDGIFLAYHNIRRMFGFQYVPLSEMDKIFHSSHLISKSDKSNVDTHRVQLDDAMEECASLIADSEFKLSVSLLGDIFDKIVASHSDNTASFNIVIHSSGPGKMHIMVKPMLDTDIAVIQSTGRESWQQKAKEPKDTKHDEFCDPWTIWQHAGEEPEGLSPDTKVYLLDVRTLINNKCISLDENPTITDPSDEWKVHAKLIELKPDAATAAYCKTFGEHQFVQNRITSTPQRERLEPSDESKFVADALEKLAPPTARQELMRSLSEKGKRLEAELRERDRQTEKIVWFPKPLDRVK